MTRADGAVVGLAAPRGSAITMAARRRPRTEGPPFPIASTQAVGPYEVSVWTDPDTTDDGTAAGRFWVTLVRRRRRRRAGRHRASVLSIHSAIGRVRTVSAPVAADRPGPRRRFVALLMDHEGPFRVHVAIDGPLGHADIDAGVDATYDLRPAPLLMVVFVMPFALVGFLWIKLLWKRRQLQQQA